MMHEKVIRRVGARGCLALGLLCGGVAACAGTDVLEIDADTRAALRDAYAGSGPVGVAGDGGAAGDGGSGGSPAGGAAGAAAAGAAGAGGEPLAGAGGDDGGGGEAGSGGTCDGFEVLGNCVGSSCHGDGAFYSAFAADEGSVSDFVGNASLIYGEACGPLFDPGSPTSSLVYRKASGTQGSACGQTMPPGSPGLSEADLTCLESWIAGL